MEKQAMEDDPSPAIDWTQPIQTTTGERAEVIGARQLAWCGAKPIKLVCVYRGGYPEGSFGDIYQLNEAGQRVDESTPELVSRAVIIRNVPKKIEGWAVSTWRHDGAEMGILHGNIFLTEKSARQAKGQALDKIGAPARHFKVVRVEMTEV